MTMLQLACFAGFFLHSIILIGIENLRKPKVWKTLIGCLVAALTLAGFAYWQDRPYGFFAGASGLLTGACLFYIFFVSLALRDYILRIVNPELLLYWSLLFVYVVHDRPKPGFLILGLVAVGFGLASCTGKWDRSLTAKFSLYILYFLLVCGVAWFGAHQVQVAITDIFLGSGLRTTSLVTAFITGMAATTIALNLAFLYALIPSRGNDIQDIKRTINTYAKHYTPDRQASRYGLYGLLIVVILLVINGSFALINNAILLPIAITASQIFSSGGMPNRSRRTT